MTGSDAYSSLILSLIHMLRLREQDNFSVLLQLEDIFIEISACCFGSLIFG